MSQELMRFGRHKHDKSNNSFHFFIFEREGNQADVDKMVRDKSIKPVHFHFGEVNHPDITLAKWWILSSKDIRLADAKGLKKEDKAYVERVARKNIDLLISGWENFFGIVNTVFVDGNTEAPKVSEKKRKRNR